MTNHGTNADCGLRIADCRGSVGRRALPAFSLIDLLATLAIIAVLVPILVQSLSRARTTDCGHKTIGRLKLLDTAINHYFQETNRMYYPGQQSPRELAGDGGAWTGAQWAGRTLFTKVGGAFPGDYRRAPAYVSYDARLLLADDPLSYGNPGANRRNMALSDGCHDAMAICYYVSRPRTPDGKPMAQFKEADNAAHTDPDKSSESMAFTSFITDPGSPNRSVPYKNKGFLLIAPGSDRKYFTPDDLTNFRW